MKGFLKSVIVFFKRMFFFKKKEDDTESAKKVLFQVNRHKGLLWEKIESFKDELAKVEGFIGHELGEEQEDELKKTYPIKQELIDGPYVRELFAPKGSLIVTFIHKQRHPAFLLKGELSILLDTGEIKRIKGPQKIITEIGTQRVAYIHEDVTWTCVHRTDATNFLDAEKEAVTDNFRLLPKEFLTKNNLLCHI